MHDAQGEFNLFNNYSIINATIFVYFCSNKILEIMKRIFLIICLLGAVLTSCSKDTITSTTAVDDGSDSSSDIYSADDFEHTVSIVYSGSSATVEGLTDLVTASISGAGVTITNADTSLHIIYRLSGSSSSGYLKLYSPRRQALLLDGLTLSNPNGAAINVQSHKRTHVVLSGSSTLADGATYSATPADEDEKAALFGEGQFIFSGNGSLTVHATGKAAITSDDYVRFMSGVTVNATSSAGHGVRGKDYILVSGGTVNVEVSADMKKGFSSDSLVRIEGGATTITVTGSAAYDSESSDYSSSAGVRADQRFEMADGSLYISNSGRGGKGISGDGTALFSGGSCTVSVSGDNITSGSGRNATSLSAAKAIRFDGAIAVTGGTLFATATAHEAIESKSTIDITGGTVYAYSAGDDAINAAGNLTIDGGQVYGHTDGTEEGADGIDANGNIYIKSGLVYAICTHGSPDVALDANTESRMQLYVSGGTLIVVGGLENGASLTQTCYQASSASRNTWYGMTVGSDTYAFKTPASGSGLVVSGASQPVLVSNPTVSGGTEIFNGMLKLSPSLEGGSSVSLTQYSGGNGGGPGGGGHGPGGWK